MPPAFPGDRSSEITAALDALPSHTPVSEVARRLLDLFTGGSITPGTRLPPERRLAEALGVGRSAVREALAALEILGIVDVRPGSGTYLRGSARELLPQTLRWGLLIGESKTAELLELRSGLEIFAARRAAARVDEEGTGLLRESLERMRSAAGDLEGFVSADLDFHQTLGTVAGNETLVDMLAVVQSLLQVYADRAVHRAEDAQVALEEHTAVFEAVAARNEDAAASAMATHMATATRRLAAAVSVTE